MREDLKGQNLSFTEIAKLVGENWQGISPDEKEPFETQAQQAKEKYNHSLAEYKKTPEYRRYAHYLQEFKHKQASQGQGVYSSSSRKRPSPRGSLEIADASLLPALTRSLSWEVKDAAKRPKLEAMRSLHGSSTSATSTSGSCSLGGGSGSGSDSQPGSEPPPTRQQRRSIVSMTDPHFSARTARTTSVSRQQSIDKHMTSPTSPASTKFDSGFAGSPHASHARNHCQWRDPSRPSSDGKHQHLPSLSDMLNEDQKMTGMPTSPDGNGTGYGQYLPALQRNERPSLKGGKGLLRGRPPTLRHEHSSSGSLSSSGSVCVGVHARSSKDASLPIHALLSNKSSSSPSPPLYGQLASMPQRPDPRQPYSSQQPGQSSIGNGT